VRRESKVINLLSFIHSRIILDLVCGCSGSVGEGVCADVSFLRAKRVGIYRRQVDEIW